MLTDVGMAEWRGGKQRFPNAGLEDEEVYADIVFVVG